MRYKKDTRYPSQAYIYLQTGYMFVTSNQLSIFNLPYHPSSSLKIAQITNFTFLDFSILYVCTLTLLHFTTLYSTILCYTIIYTQQTYTAMNLILLNIRRTNTPHYIYHVTYSDTYLPT